MSNISLPPFVKKFKQTVITGTGTLPAVTEFQRRVTLMIHPKAEVVLIKFNTADPSAITLQPYTLFSIEGYNGIVEIISPNNGDTVIYEGLI